MKVWIVMRGEIYEGGGIMGVYDSEAKAKKYAEGLKLDIGICDWVEYTDYEVE